MKCKGCGKTIPDNKKYCSKQCFINKKKKIAGKETEPLYTPSKPTQEWINLKKKSVCLRCGKELKNAWISAYCPACENNYEIVSRKNYK